MRLRFELGGVVGGKKDLKERIGEKFGTLDKYLGRVKEDFHAAVIKILKGDRFGYRVKVDMKLPGKELVVESKAAKLLDAVDLAQNKANRVVRKYLEKIKDKRR